MSSMDFIIVAKGKNAQVAFDKAVEQALYDHGHNGYTGTIAEKQEEGFIRFPFKKGGTKDEAFKIAEHLIRHDCRIDSKYEPAGCITLKRGTYLFFGKAQC
jgi:ribosomal protein L21E